MKISLNEIASIVVIVVVIFIVVAIAVCLFETFIRLMCVQNVNRIIELWHKILEKVGIIKLLWLDSLERDRVMGFPYTYRVYGETNECNFIYHIYIYPCVCDVCVCSVQCTMCVIYMLYRWALCFCINVNAAMQFKVLLALSLRQNKTEWIHFNQSIRMMYAFQVVSFIFIYMHTSHTPYTIHTHEVEVLFYASVMSTFPKQVNIERFSLDFYRLPSWHPECWEVRAEEAGGIGRKRMN